jgi:phage-related protein
MACLARIELLAARGHQLRRPHADYLRDGIYELRIKAQDVQYRLLYFFHGQQTIVLSHGFVKQHAAVPHIEIERARMRKASFSARPQEHTHKET